MPLTNITATADNGVQRVSTSQSFTSNTGTVEQETLIIEGTSGRLAGNVTISRSQILVRDNIGTNRSNATSVLGYWLSGGSRLDTLHQVIITNNSSIRVDVGSGWTRYHLFLSRIDGDSVVSEKINSGVRKGFIYLQPGGTLQNATLENVLSLEITAQWTIFENVSLLNTEVGILNFEAGRLDPIGVNIPSTSSTWLSALGDGNSGNNSFYFWNPVSIDLTKIIHRLTNAFHAAGYTIAWRFFDTAPIQNVLVIYRDDRASLGGSFSEIGRYTTNSSGRTTGTTDSRTGSTGSNTERALFVRTKQTTRQAGSVSTGLSGSAISSSENYSVDNVNYRIEIRSYRHLDPGLQNPTLTAPLGEINGSYNPTVWSDFFLLVDAGITQTDPAIAAAYSGISVSGTTVTVSASRTASELYDFLCAYWRNNDGFIRPQQSGTTLDLRSLNLTIASGGNVTSTSKYTRLLTTGTITLTGTGTTNTSRQDTNGAVGVASFPNLPSGTKYLLKYADGANEEIAIGATSGSGLTLFVPGNTRLIHLAAIKVTSSPLYASNLLTGAYQNSTAGFTSLDGLTENLLYTEFGLDGLSATIASKFTFDTPNLQVDANEADGIITAQEIHAFVVGQLFSNDAAIRLGYDPLEALSSVSYRVLSGWKVQNVSTTVPLLITNGIYFDEDGNAYNPCASAAGGLQSTSLMFEPSHTVTVTGGFETSDRTNLTAIKAKTDSLSFVSGDVRATLDGEKVAVSAIDNNVITAAVIATDAIDGDAIATSAITEIQSGLATPDDVQVTVDGGFSGSDRTKLNSIPSDPLLASNYTVPPTAEQIKTEVESSTVLAKANALSTVAANILKLLKYSGLVSGVSTSARSPSDSTPGYLRTSDNEIRQTLTKSGEIINRSLDP